MNIRCRPARGFTLIELLVVIAIIGLLASIILASLNTAQQKGRDARRVSDIQEIQNALELYDQTCGGYPYPTAVHVGLGTGDNNGCPSGVDLGTFISPIPTDPSSGLPYLYAAFGSTTYCSTYHLGAQLEVQTTQGAGASPSSSAKCGGSQIGAYRDDAGNQSSCSPGNNATCVIANNGDFQGGATTLTNGTSAYVYDVTP